MSDTSLADLDSALGSSFDDGSAPATEVSAPAESGQGEPEVTEQPAPKSYVNVDELGDHFVKITVDGVEHEVPLKQAISQQMMHADYTRKTQSVAEQREANAEAVALREAWEANPLGTLAWLQSQLVQQDGYGVQEPEVEYASDEERILAQTQRLVDEQVAPLREDFGRRVMANTVRGLQQKYGEDFDVVEVAERMKQTGLTDPSAMETVYKVLEGEKALGRKKAERDVTQQRATQEAAVTASKAQVVDHGASSAIPGAAPAPEPQSFREIARQALRDNGFS